MEQASALRVVVSEVLSQLGALKTLSKHSAPLVRGLLRVEPQMWSFLQDPDLPIHNNAQERELRSVATKRHLSFGKK